ncbi:MAG: hypothetical protein A3H69_00120 [Candidatus Sungbacteria bacterium RIFCSPLOWO2_02_FULL_47_9]|uniref:SHS2 domain-containing protein n=1 Tax=Candidatus Sungbacteria bacterium RIFCSPHIGHO2_01_FULL_47_32 TaxID=1802264 RepID=A0A1G2K7G3_9BACT|nr:MAG: Actin-like protein ATPase involved in cell division-like protein [Parcubacteria group bacterium GW2011_GWA2_47_10]OGZ94420.1 MAG: hypothetical protein A2633_04035 [Candidatus Sungbacteria bacterium RIFCSPHIGHO2_01_FULL_47_32]OGZ98012.1 MAG: hypothetical protein A3D57_02740 [Candidatus Sungbacteria bacterium RIFCSPHIGHO2_02_FULL_46_12]OHA05762.1 MAG: hypothetical protein A3A28_05500 [Candidatus Sungbacteria bacterium RIFCSPLOWO2_01_FULL_47_32]OHA12175.1 MAG: hypothetical protein A3H69_00
MKIASLFSNFLAKASPDVRVVIDIGSMSIKTVLLEKRGRDICVLKKLVVELPVREEMLSIIKFVNAYIREELFKIIKDLHRVPKKITIGFSGDYLENSIEAIAVERPHKSRNISEEEVAAIFKKSLGEITSRREGMLLVDSFPVRVLVDGYEIEDVYKDMKGQRIGVYIFASFMKKEHWEQFKNLGHILGGIPIKFVSNQFVNAFSIPKVLKANEALLIDVGARATEISLVRGGRIYSIERFLFGGHTITKAIAKALDAEYADADSIKRQYQEQVLPQSVVSKIKGAVDESVASWLKEFISALSLDPHLMIPDNVFIFGGGAFLPELRAVLETGEWTKGFSWKQKTNISFLSAENISHGLLEEAKLTGFNEISFLSLIYYSYFVS